MGQTLGRYTPITREEIEADAKAKEEFMRPIRTRGTMMFLPQYTKWVR